MGWGGKQDHGGAVKRLRWDHPHGCPGGTCDLSPLPKRERERERSKQIWIFPINPEIQRDQKSYVRGRQFEGGRGSLTAGETDGARFSQSPPHARVPRSSPPGAGSESWGRTARGDDPPASGTGAAGVGAELRAARGQVANWIRERRGESHGRGGEPGRGAGGRQSRRAGQLSPPAVAQPSSPAGEKRLSGRVRRLPWRRYLSLKAPARSLS